MWLKGAPGFPFYLEVRFTHVHADDRGIGQHHEHDALVATVEAHALAHRLGSYGEPSPKV